MKQPTANEIASDALNAQRPLDRNWLKRLYDSFENEKARRLWAKGCLEASSLYNKNKLSRQLIDRAVTCFLDQVKLEI